MSPGLLKIGQVARGAGLSTKALRFYEARGVLPTPTRGDNGYRLYAPEIVGTLRFIKQAQGLGLTLDEIREIVAIRRGGRPPCRHVHRILTEKAAELDRKLQDLLMLQRRIRQSLAAWRRGRAGAATVCPHIEAADARSLGRQHRSRS